MFRIRDASPPPQPFTRRPRPGGPASIVQIQWHATRGATSMDRQVQATESWFASPANNRGGWGGSAEFVVGPDHRRDGAIEIVRFGDTYNEFSSWSAGFGGTGTIGAATVGIAIEVAQPAGRDAQGNFTGSPNANFEHFTDQTIDACVWLVGQINRELAALDVPPIPPVRIPAWDQRVGEPVPAGHIGHEDLANGVRLGKHDPGHLFPWSELIMRVATGGPVLDLGAMRRLHDRLEAQALVSFRAARDTLGIAREIESEIARLEGS